MTEPGVGGAVGATGRAFDDLVDELRRAAPVRLAHWMRLPAALVVPLLRPEVLASGPAVAAYLTALAVIVATMPLRRSPLVDALDVVVTVGAVAASGGFVLPFLPLILILVTTVALTPSLARGLAVGVVVSGALLVEFELRLGLGGLDGGLVIPLLVLPPLTGLAAALGTRAASEAVRGRGALQQANRLLGELDRLADELPGSLDVRAVCRATVEEVRAFASPTFVGVYLNYDGVLVPAATAGVEDTPLPPFPLDDLPGDVPAGPARAMHLHELPRNLRGPATRASHWSVCPIRRRNDLLGLVLVGENEPDRRSRLRDRLTVLADDAALAVDSAKLLDRVRDRALRTAQRQMANDLHDGVAQSLAHLRMELELLARKLQEPDDEEQAIRLSRVAHRSLADVRTMIAGLRRDLPAVPFSTLLRDQVQDLNGLGDMQVRVTVDGEPLLTVAQRADLAHLVQEAVSNAVRHSDGSRVDVVLVDDEDGVRVSVADDGTRSTPVADNGNGDGGGVGRSAMRERAKQLGGDLKMYRRPSGGTVVSVSIPSSELVATGW